MRTVAEHRRVVESLFPTPQRRTTALHDSLGCALASDLVAPIALPGFDNSAMDGYAVRAADIAGASTDDPVSMVVAQDIPAGRTDRLRLEPGTAHRIMTGAPIPDGADAVIKVELTDGQMPTVAIYSPVDLGANIRRAGSDISRGDDALTTGTVINAPQLGFLAALGFSEVETFAPLSVLVLSTGTELVSPGTPLEYGQIYESNGAMLTAACMQAGAHARQVHFVADDVDAFHQRLAQEVTDDVDLIITSGGVSAGAYEVVKDALASADVEFVKVAMQPGMPQGCGRIDVAGRDIPVITLPGNPVSALVSFEAFIRPPLRAAMGLPPSRPQARAVLTADVRSPVDKCQFNRGQLRVTDAGLTIDPIGPPASHHLYYLASADALFTVDQGTDFVAAGSTVDALLLHESGQ